jgi:hypothetical protein
MRRAAHDGGPVAAEPKLHFGPISLKKGVDPENAAVPEAQSNPNGGHRVESTPNNAKKAQNQNTTGYRLSTECGSILETVSSKETYSVDVVLATLLIKNE